MKTNDNLKMARVTAHRTPMENALVLLTALAMILAALALRWENLNRIDFNIDELNHIYAAKSLNANGEPALPAGTHYNRAYAFTRLCAATIDWLPGDLGARLPSLFFGIASLALLFWMTRQWFGNFCALLTLFFLAFSFEHSVYSFFIRMYTLQQFLFLLMVLVGFHLVHFPLAELFSRGNRSADVRTAAPWVRAGALLTAFAVLFLLSIHIHRLNLIILIILYVYSLWELAVTFLQRGIRGGMDTASLWIVLCGTVIAVVIILTFREEVSELYQKIRTPLSWAVGNADNTKYYYQALKEYYPFFWSLFPICAIVSAVSGGKQARLVLTAFCIPFLFQSLILATKAQRYLFYALPFLFMTVSYGTALAMNGLIDRITPITSRFENRSLQNALLTVLTVVLMGWVLRVNDPSFLERSLQIRFGAANVLAGVSFPKWRNIADKLKPSIGGDTVIITAEALPTLYYLGKLDYVVNPDYRDNGIRETSGDGTIRYYDWYTRSPYILTIEGLKSIRRQKPKGIVILKQTEAFNPKRNLFKGAVESYAHQHFQYHDDLKGKYFIYSWGLEDAS